MNRAVLLLSILLASSSFVWANPDNNHRTCQATPYHIHVIVQQVRSNHGNVAALLYGDNPDDFLARGKRLAKIRVPAKKGSVAICLPAPHPGIYAVGIYHDENDNKKFDKSWIGLPVEGFGVSNNPDIFLLPPSHAESSFKIQGTDTTVKINIQY